MQHQNEMYALILILIFFLFLREYKNIDAEPEIGASEY